MVSEGNLAFGVAAFYIWGIKGKARLSVSDTPGCRAGVQSLGNYFQGWVIFFFLSLSFLGFPSSS